MTWPRVPAAKCREGYDQYAIRRGEYRTQSPEKQLQPPRHQGRISGSPIYQSGDQWQSAGQDQSTAHRTRGPAHDRAPTSPRIGLLNFTHDSNSE